MKRLVTIIILCLVTCSLTAGIYKQTGFIKEKSSDIHKGEKVKGVKIKVRNRNATFFSGQNGEFTLDGLDRIFSFEEISHANYILVDDEDLVWKREASKEPIKILMVSPKAFIEEAKRYYEPMLAEAKKNISSLKIDNEQLTEQLRKKSERLAKIDYDDLSEVDKEVRECLLKGEFNKADSLILSKGSIEERMNYGRKAVLSIVNDFKILSDNALIKYEVDKSIEYLENIITIDPDNIPVLLELGNLYCQYKSDVNTGQIFINQALFFAKRTINGPPTELAECYSCLGTSYVYNRNYKECINALRKCLALYNVPNIPEISESSITEIDTTNIGPNPIITRKDSTIVGEAYSMSSIIYGFQGKHRLALSIKKIKKSIIKESDDVETLMDQVITESIQNFQVGLYHTVIKDLSSIMDIIKENEYTDYHVVMGFLLAGSYSQTNKIDSAYYYADKIINYYKLKRNNYYDQYYLGAWTIKAKGLVMEKKYELAIACIETVEQEIDLANVPYKDNVSVLYNNKGLAYIGKEEYEKALMELQKALDMIIELNESGTPIGDINVLINSNLAIAYEKTDQLEKARKHCYRAFSNAKTLYKEIGFEHPLFYVIVDQMYNLELTSNLYKDAIETAIMCHKLLDEEKDTYRKRIEDCYKLASKSKVYKKTKEYKELVSQYKEFKDKYPTQ